MTAAALLALALLAPPQDPAAFEAGLAKVRAQMERRQWDKAYDALRALLAANENAAHAHLEADSVREDMKRIVFWRGRAAPDPATLVSGELKKYKDGKLEIVFQGKDLADWESEDDYHRFPALFDGPFTVTIKLRNYPSDKPVALVVGANQDPWVRVSCGLQSPVGTDGYYPASVVLMSKGKEIERLDENREHKLEPAMPIELELEVTARRIALAHGGKQVLDAKRPNMEYGTFAFFGIPPDALARAEIRIAGVVQPAWMQNKTDAALQEQREAFDAGYQESEHLPAWLLAGAAPTEPEGLRPRAQPAGGAPGLRPYPGPELAGAGREEYRRAIDELKRIGASGDAAAQSAHVDRLADEGVLAPVLLAFLRLRIAEESGRAEQTLDRADEVLKADAAHLATRRARARALALLGRHAEAEQAWDEAVREHPGHAELVHEFVEHLLDRNRIARASEIVQAATVADPSLRAGMERLRSILAMADKGPAFSRTFEYTSAHYVVRSDISREVCYEAAQLLEKALTSYSVRLRRAESAESNRFRVYLFAGEASYLRYMADAFGSKSENTAGVYSPFVKQLLIWNLPDAADRERTIVHEGFHQYLDSVTDASPVWFNEGLAEYYELAETKDGKFVTGQVNGRHAALLRSRGTRPLAEFLALPHAAFYEPDEVSRNYAQAWAFIHFLRHGEREHRAIFDALFERLTEGASAGHALREAFGGVPTAELEAAFHAHVASLGAR